MSESTLKVRAERAYEDLTPNMKAVLGMRGRFSLKGVGVRTIMALRDRGILSDGYRQTSLGRDVRLIAYERQA